MRRLICAFVVRIWHKTPFLMAWLIYIPNSFTKISYFFLNNDVFSIDILQIFFLVSDFFIRKTNVVTYPFSHERGALKMPHSETVQLLCPKLMNCWNGFKTSCSLVICIKAHKAVQEPISRSYLWPNKFIKHNLAHISVLNCVLTLEHFNFSSNFMVWRAIRCR